MNAMLQIVPPAIEPEEEKKPWILTEISPKHEQVCTLLAQGIPQVTIAVITGFTREYIFMLSKQPLIQECIRKYTEIAELQLGAMFVKSVEAIGDTLDNGSYGDKMKAARLQLEATKRIGPRTSPERELIDSNARLTRLAERLLYLQGKGSGEVLNMKQQEDGSYAQESTQPISP